MVRSCVLPGVLIAELIHPSLIPRLIRAEWVNAEITHENRELISDGDSRAMKRALVTGATGFIGRHLVRVLSERGYDVACLVRTVQTEIHSKRMIRSFTLVTWKMRVARTRCQRNGFCLSSCWIDQKPSCQRTYQSESRWRASCCSSLRLSNRFPQ